MGLKVIISVFMIASSCQQAFGQRKDFQDEATATVVLISLAAHCGDEPNNEQYAYSERVAKIAWGQNYKEQVIRNMIAVKTNFEKLSLKEQAETCKKVAVSLKNLK